jgi:drug/metabolite transporter, DME family
MSPRQLVLIAAVLFGTTGTAQALGPEETTPVAVGAVRIVVGGLLLVAAARALVPAERRTARWPVAWTAGAAVGVAAYQLAFFAGVARTGVAIGTVVAIGSAPAIAGALGRLAGDGPLGARWAAATALACAGVVLLVLGSGADTSVDPLGVLLALGAGAGYAAYAVASKRLLVAGHAPERVMAAAFGGGAILLLPVLPLAGIGWLAQPSGLALALFLGAFPTALAYILFARGLRRLPTGEVATLTLAEPVTAAALGALVLGERPGLAAVAGAALVLLGLVALALPRRTRDPVPATAHAG